MIRKLALAAALLVAPQTGFAFCDTPLAPTPTSEDMARDYREEFKAEFETYFSEAQSYLRCIDSERQNVMDELKNTAFRYERFLKDSEGWAE